MVGSLAGEMVVGGCFGRAVLRVAEVGPSFEGGGWYWGLGEYERFNGSPGIRYFAHNRDFKVVNSCAVMAVDERARGGQAGTLK